MKVFREGDAEKQIKSISVYFDSLNYPSQELSSEAKAFMSNFFGSEGFVGFCDLLFGPYHDRSFSEQEELCWMDYANIAPTDSLANSLWSIMDPSSSFISTLEAISTPPSSFASRLKSGWKNNAEARPTAPFTTDLPLSAIYPQSFQLMAEPADTNLYSLPRSRLPPVLLIPFWEPPIVTRKELSQQQILTSLPCTPLGYFIFRLFFFGLRRVHRIGSSYLAERQYTTISSKIQRAKEVVVGVFYKQLPVDMPFYSEVLRSYVSNYVSASLPRRLSSKSAVTEVAWTVNDVVAALLVTVPTLLAHRNLIQPSEEYTRTGCANGETLAQVLSVIPLHTLMVYSMVHQRRNSLYGDGQSISYPDFALSASSRAKNDIENIHGTLYRNCLIILREALLSLEMEPSCKAAHFTYCLELWAVLMDPFESQQVTLTSQYVLHHFEVFAFITVDVLNMIVKSSFVLSMNEKSARVLKRCLFLLSQEAVTNLLAEIHASQPSLRGVAEVVNRQFVLNWMGSDGNVQIVDLHGSTACDLAARTYVALEKLLKSEVTETLQSDVREILSFMSGVFPGMEGKLESWRSSRRSSTKDPSPRTSISSTVSKRLTDNERSLFFKGGKEKRKIFARNLLLPTRDGRVPGGRNPAFQTALRDEVPLLLGATRFMDAVIEKAMETYYTTLIPKCDRGHNLWLLYSANYACCNHASEAAIWECSLCERVYGHCCKGFPYNSATERYLPCDADRLDAPQCITCGQVLPEDSNLFYAEGHSGQYLCPDCASRPFKAPSTRVLADYSTWAAILVAISLYCLIRFLSS